MGLMAFAHKIFLFVFYRILMRLTLRFVAGVEFSGQKLLGDKTSIVVANHNSHMDTMAFLASLPWSRIDKGHPVAAKEYFAKNRFSRFLSRLFLNAIFVERKSGQSLKECLQPVTDRLQSGHSVLMFPEGSRGKPEISQKLKPGIAYLAATNPEIPIEIMRLQGFGLALPKGSWMLVPCTCQCEIKPALKIKMGMSEADILKTLHNRMFDDVIAANSETGESPVKKPKPLEKAA